MGSQYILEGQKGVDEKFISLKENHFFLFWNKEDDGCAKLSRILAILRC